MAARRAPLILRCLQTLFEQSQDGVGFDDALRALAKMLADHVDAGEFEIGERVDHRFKIPVLSWKSRWLVRGASSHDPLEVLELVAHDEHIS